MRKLLVLMALFAGACSPAYWGKVDPGGRIHPGPDRAGGALVFGRAVMRFQNWRVPGEMKMADGYVTKGLKLQVTAFADKKKVRAYTVYPDDDGYFQLVNVDPSHRYKVTKIELPVLGYAKEPEWPAVLVPSRRLLNLGQYVLSVDSNGRIDMRLIHADTYLSTDEAIKLAIARNSSTGWVKFIRARLTDLGPDNRGGALIFGMACVNVRDRKGRITTRRDGLRVVISQFAPAFYFGRITVFTDENGYFQLTNVPRGYSFAVERILDDRIGLSAKLPSPQPLLPRGRVLNMGVATVNAQVAGRLYCKVVGPDVYDAKSEPFRIALEKHKKDRWRALLEARLKSAAPAKKSVE